MDHIASSPTTEKVIQLAEIDDLVQALHTFYEFANMPSMMIQHRHSNGEDIQEPLYITVKSTFKANKFKDDADASFFKKDYQQALYLYTQCLRYAEKGSEIVAKAYANRSAASFKLGKYLECKSDITRAFRAKYPKDMRKTLLDRYERCSISLMANPPNLASDTVASSSNQAGEGREKPVETDVRIIKEEIDGEWREMCVDLTNPLLRRTSNKIRLECNETWGRHMVASEYIKAGEILSCERFFSILMKLDETFRRCSYCNSISYALVPCNLCPKVMYCSTYCRRRAFNLFHRIECRIFRYEKLCGDAKKSGYTMFALRMLLVGTDQGAGLETLMKKMTMRDIFAEKVDPAPNKPFSSDYSEVLKLMRTFPKPLLNFNSNPGMIVRLIIALQETGYFGRKNALPQKRLTNKELFAALLLTNHMLSVPSTGFGLYQILNKEGTQRNLVGKGIPILHNMINHSCYPNAFYLSRYLENALIAVRPISENEQIFITTCEPYYIAPLRQRQKQLANPEYLRRFTCQCEACIHDWPTGKQLEKSLTETFLYTNIMKAAVSKFDEEITGVMDMSRTEIRRVMSRSVEWLYANLAKPSFALVEYEHMHQTFMKYLYDTFRQDTITMRQDLILTEVSETLIDIHQMLVHSLLKYS